MRDACLLSTPRTSLDLVSFASFGSVANVKPGLRIGWRSAPCGNCIAALARALCFESSHRQNSL